MHDTNVPAQSSRLAGRLAFCLASPLLALVAAQTVHFRQIAAVVPWMISHPAAALMNYLLCLAVLSLGAALVNRLFAGYALLIFLAYGLATVDTIKWHFALTHFVFSDFFKSSDASRFAELVAHYAKPSVILPLLLLLAAGFAAAWPLRRRLFRRWTQRVAVLAASLLVLAGFVFYNSWSQAAVCRQVLHLPVFSSQDFDRNVEDHGVLLAFMGHIRISLTDQDQPAAYSAQSMAAVSDFLQTPPFSPSGPAAVPATASSVKPTIIVLAVESLWDVTRLQGVHFDQDPFAAFRADYAGEAVAGCFGGLTANTEFEFMTSYSMQFMVDSACPFLNIAQPVPSLARYLGQLGYWTTAMHGYGKTFYRRSTVMPLLGFDVFRGLEDLPNPQNKGWYMADEDLAPRIAGQLAETTDPQLIYVLTIQNHGPYAAGRYTADETDTAAQPTFDASLKLSAKDQASVASYTQGVVDAGKLYQAVKDTCGQLDRPVILLAFGDHLPSIGDSSGTDVFLKTGLARTVMDQSMYSLPVMCWRNPAAREQAAALNSPDFKLEQPTSFNYLAPKLLTSAGLPLNPFYRLVSLTESVYPVLTAKRRSETPAADVAALAGLTAGQLLDACARVQYDQLWGRQYLERELVAAPAAVP